MSIRPKLGADTPPSSSGASGETAPARLRRLLPAGEPTVVEHLVEELDLAGRAAEGPGTRPYVLLNMISTADGRATLGGRSGAIGGAADRELFHGLRTVVDAVMVGGGTIRAERYRKLVRDERAVEARRRRGLAEQPLACIVSGRLALDSEIPLLADPGARVAILTSSRASLPHECRAEIDYVRATRDGLFDLPRALGELRKRLAVGTLLCEGGPHLNSQLLADGLVDELFLSLSPKLAGGDGTGEALRILSGPELDPPTTLELVGALEHDSHLFLRYRVGGS
jgi:riboflavin-specific deaminase-like protein